MFFILQKAQQLENLLIVLSKAIKDINGNGYMFHRKPHYDDVGYV